MQLLEPIKYLGYYLA